MELLGSGLLIRGFWVRSPGALLTDQAKHWPSAESGSDLVAVAYGGPAPIVIDVSGIAWWLLPLGAIIGIAIGRAIIGIAIGRAIIAAGELAMERVRRRRKARARAAALAARPRTLAEAYAAAVPELAERPPRRKQ